MSGSAARRATAIVCALLCASVMLSAQESKSAPTKPPQATKPAPPSKSAKPKPAPAPKPGQPPPSSANKTETPSSHDATPDTSGDQTTPSEVDPQALAGENERLKKENQQLQDRLDAARKERPTDRSANKTAETIPAQSTSLLSMASIVLLLVGLSFQVLVLLRTRPQPLEPLRAPLAEVENAVRSLEASLRHLLAQRDQDRMALDEANRAAE